MVVGNARNLTGKSSLLDFLIGSEVDHGRDAELREHGFLVGLQAIEAVGTEHPAPANPAAVCGGVPTEVAEVEHLLEGDMAARGAPVSGRRGTGKLIHG